ncbi:MAG: thioredoxin domain-containing protein [Terriglobales bacterium]
MRRFVAVATLVGIAVIVPAQEPAKPKPTTPGGAQKTAATALPPKAIVDTFLRQMFGFEPDVTWTLANIKPSDAAGIAEIDVNMKSAKNNGERKLYVLRGHKQAVAGNMVAFPGEGERPSDAAINSFVRQMTGGPNPAVTWTISEIKPRAVSDLTQVTVLMNTPQGRGAAAFMVTADGKHALMGEVIPFGANPFAANRAKLLKGINGPSRGPANAPVTIVEFADLQCPACKAALPEIQKLIADEPNAKFVFQQFPLTMAHHWAMKAAEYGDCVHRENPAAFWKYVDAVYAAQEQITSETNNTDDAGTKAEGKLKQLAAGAGVDGEKVAACASQAATEQRIKQSMALGKEVDVTGTPTLYVNGRRINNLGSLSYEQLKRLVDFMAKQPK